MQKDLDRSEKELESAREQVTTWQKEARDCVVRYGSDDQKLIQNLKETIRNLEESLKAAQADVQREKKALEAVTRDKTKLEKVGRY